MTLLASAQYAKMSPAEGKKLAIFARPCIGRANLGKKKLNMILVFLLLILIFLHAAAYMLLRSIVSRH
jgi:hypothetical protein